MDLMIVESPNKAKHIQDYVGSGIKVIASYGHIRDLPLKSMGIDFDGWKLHYEVPSESKQAVAQIIKLAKNAGKIYVATDPDREGEAIAWHLAMMLKIKPNDVLRVKYGDVSKKSILNALANPEKLNMNLVRAQEARRAIDRLVGYTVSPILSRSVGEKLSAGRVQSVAVRLIVERFLDNKNHKSIKHHGAEIFLEGFKAKWDTGPIIGESGAEYNFDRDLAQQAADVANVIVREFEVSEATKKPNPPFSNATFQQVGAKKLGLPIAKIMQLGQALFEKGLITYHRTDSVELEPDSIQAIRNYADSINLPVPQNPNVFKNKKGAQEAHEAIRPTDITDDAPSMLNGDELELYRLIHRRALASQLAPAKLSKTKVLLVSQDNKFQYKANGSVVKFAGFLELEQSDENEAEAISIPLLAEGQSLSIIDSKVLDLETKPPKLFTEESLLSVLEKKGIGRPATWAAIITNIQNRGYVGTKGKALVPSDVGIRLYEALQGFGFVEYDFTSNIEDLMDEITHGKGTYEKCVSQVFSTVLDDIRTHLGYTGDGSDLFLSGDDRDFTPTPKMLDFVTKIIRGLNLVDEVVQKEVDQKSGKSVKAFLEKYIPKYNATRTPTPAQIDFARKIADQLDETLSDELLSSQLKLSQWIDVNKDKAAALQAPTEKQINAARKVAENNGVPLPDECTTNRLVCSQFLDKYAKRNKGGKAKGRKKS